MKRLAVLFIAVATFATACAGNVFSLEVGQCFNDPGDFEEVSSVEKVGCEEVHDNEVYALFDLAGTSFPGEALVREQGSDGCLARFEDYVGRDFESSTLDIGMLFPTAETWADDDREVVCFLNNFVGDNLTGSALNSGL